MVDDGGLTLQPGNAVVAVLASLRSIHPSIHSDALSPPHRERRFSSSVSAVNKAKSFHHHHLQRESGGGGGEMTKWLNGFSRKRPREREARELEYPTHILTLFLFRLCLHSLTKTVHLGPGQRFWPP